MSLSQLRSRLRRLRTSISRLFSLPGTLSRVLLLLLMEMASITPMVLLVAVGSAKIARAFLPPSSALGVGMVMFGSLTLILRQDRKKKKEGGD